MSTPKYEPEVYAVVTQRDGIKSKTGIEVETTEYIVLATSVSEAVAIVEDSTTDETEVVRKAWHVTHFSKGLKGTKYVIGSATGSKPNTP